MIKLDKSKVITAATVVTLFGAAVVLMYFTMSRRHEKIQSSVSSVEKPEQQNGQDKVGDSDVGGNDSPVTKADGGLSQALQSGQQLGSRLSQFDVDAHRVLADIYFHRGEFSKALRHYERIAGHYTGDERDTILVRKSVCYMNVNEFEKAFRAATAISPNYNSIFKEVLVLRTRFEKALSLGNSGGVREAVRGMKSLIERVRNANESRENLYEIYINMAEMLFYSGVPLGEVKRYLRLAIDSNVKQDYRAYALQGKIFLNDKKYSQAVQHFLRSTKYFPFNGEIHNLLGLSYFNLGNHENALRHFNIAISINPYDYRSYYNRGILYRQTRRDSLAFDSFRRAYEVNKQNYKALYNIGLIYRSQNEHKKAILVLEKAIEIIRRKRGKLERDDIDIGLALVGSYTEISTEKYNSKASELLVELCLVDPLNSEALSKYEQITGRIFRISKYQ